MAFAKRVNQRGYKTVNAEEAVAEWSDPFQASFYA